MQTLGNVTRFGELGILGQAAATAISSLTDATADVKVATALVNKLTSDVKMGLAPRSDLVKALDDLNHKVEIVKSLTAKSKALSGYLGTLDGSWMTYSLVVAAIVVTVIIFLKFKNK